MSFGLWSVREMDWNSYFSSWKPLSICCALACVSEMEHCAQVSRPFSWLPETYVCKFSRGNVNVMSSEQGTVAIVWRLLENCSPFPRPLPNTLSTEVTPYQPPTGYQKPPLNVLLLPCLQSPKFCNKWCLQNTSVLAPCSACLWPPLGLV